MAKRKSPKAQARGKAARKRTPARASGRRPKTSVRAKSAKRSAPRGTKKAAAARKPAARKAATARKTTRPRGPAPAPGRGIRTKAPRLDRERRRLEESVPTPPSSLDMNRHGTSVRSGRAELADTLKKHGSITPGITGGDVDANYENAYFSGDEAPGGDNPTPDQEVVDDIGKALGVEYQDNEELKSSDKVSARDKHRWELDPASSEDYNDRD